MSTIMVLKPKSETVHQHSSLNPKNRPMWESQWTVLTAIEPSGFENRKRFSQVRPLEIFFWILTSLQPLLKAKASITWDAIKWDYTPSFCSYSLSRLLSFSLYIFHFCRCCFCIFGLWSIQSSSSLLVKSSSLLLLALLSTTNICFVVNY